MNKQITGYPSVDKPWLKFYSEEAINAPLPECTLYENLLENNKDYPKDIAIRYFSRKISYKELIENKLAEISYFEPSEFKEGKI